MFKGRRWHLAPYMEGLARKLHPEICVCRVQYRISTIPVDLFTYEDMFREPIINTNDPLNWFLIS